MQMHTQSGWTDIGKTYIDLHVIANDLQPIPVHAELQKCLVKGSFLDYVISPHLMEHHTDDYTVDSTMSEISEMTGGGETPRSSRRQSLTKRLSQSMGLSARDVSTISPAKARALRTAHLGSKVPSIPDPL